MSNIHAPPSRNQFSLIKQKSWSPDSDRDEAWLRRKAAGKKKRRSKSVTDEDLEELKACVELGFGFDSVEAELDRKLVDVLPGLVFYYAVNKQYKNDAVLRSLTTSSLSSASLTSSTDCESLPCSPSNPLAMFGPGDSTQMMKTRLRQWAQVVACSVRQISC
ncbi:hypothetical protein ACFE04_001118 [Oxalis oulophora]